MGDSILVGVTDTQASRRAVDWAARRAREQSGRIELISIIGGVIGTVGEGTVVNEAIDLTRAMLEREAERVRAREVPVETRLGRGNPVEELINESIVFDLLVIGSDYRGPDTGTNRGPHGVRIVAGAHCPVAVVPDIDLTGRSGVIVGVDGSPISESAIEFAAAEADRSGEVLTAVSTWTTVPLPLDMRSYPMNYLSAMQKLTEEALAISLAGIMQKYPDLTVQKVVERGYPAPTINRLAVDARLTVVGSRGRGAVARFLLGSTSQEVLTHLATTTVVVR
ncbi:universal stress protein [Microbacterium profundi]|uniref:universal stress protein n=1 Tax=Microbacterium profundi TaxID=450380 RepID=UPI0019D0B56C|nr:universal stress protein [Microbacterium profundi]MCE7481829.1 universal stress protein [Microbacterium profundi]